jgi:hypothetical protein
LKSAAPWNDKKESFIEFDARIAMEDLEAIKVPCPLESCGAEIGEPCCTEAGQPRCRHARRLWIARKQEKD